MKVTHVYRYSYPPLHGGIEQHIHTLVHQLKRQHRPEVLVSGTRPGLTRDDGVPIRSTGCWGHFSGAPISPTMPASLRRSGSDLFHFHMPNPTGEMSYMLAGLSTPSVATYHMETVRYARALKIYRPLLERFLNRLKRIIVATPQHISTSTILPKYRDKCRIIPYGIDVQRFAPTPAILDRAASLREQFGERIVLFVGKFRHYKGLKVLLRAMEQVSGKLLLVGEGEEKEELQALAAELHLADRIVWMSHLEQEDFLATFYACDVFALPSIYRTETFGIAQLEAQACGKPVVCTSLGTGVEYVNQHERTGLVVPPGDADALAAALNRLLSDEDYRRGLGEAAKLRVHREFTQEQMTAAILKVYEETLDA